MANETGSGEKFVRRIDLGDGGGVQVFEADTQDELVDKLVEAQRNATAKIRELNRKAKLGRDLETGERATPEAPRKVAPMSREELERATREMFDPATAPAALRRMMEAEFEAPIDEVRQSVKKVRALEQAEAEKTEGLAFMNANPEYKPCPQNQAALTDYLAKHGLAFTRRNLQTAFDDLKEDGLLLLETTEKEEPTTTTTEEPRIVRRPRGETATAIRETQTAQAVPKRNAGPTQAEIERMSPDEYYQRILVPQLAHRTR